MTAFEKRSRAQQAAAVVGVDAGKFRHVLVVRLRGQPDSKPFAFPTTRAGFDDAVSFIRRQTDAPAAQMLVGIEFAGNYGFTLAHYLDQLGYPVVSVLPAHTRRWKEVAHNLTLKTDAKDALGITDLTAQGHFVGFPFLQPAYAELRYLVSGRDRLSRLRRGGITRLRTVLQVVFPEFEQLFKSFTYRTPFAVLEAFPGPQEILAAPKRAVLRVLKTASRGHLAEQMYQQLVEAARGTLALASAQGALRAEIGLLIQRHALYEEQIAGIEDQMVAALEGLPEAESLLSIPLVAPVTAAGFIGAIGDPQAYDSSRQILRLAGLTLVEKSSGTHQGQPHISKQGRPGLRALAYLLAVRGIARQGPFRAEYDRLMARNGGQPHKAFIAIARRALRMMFAVARERRAWTPEAPSRTRPLADSAAGGIV
ncbi:MAG: IS110 family transposase [Gemmatimonadales bacterium]|jgi:transposase